MKYLSLLILVLATVGSSFAQITYESPHVKDGKTMQLSIPEGFYEFSGLSTSRNTVYSNLETIDFDVEDITDLPVGLLTIAHLPREDESLESMMEELKREVNNNEEDLAVFQSPKIVDKNGRRTMYAGLKGDIIDMDLDRMYLCVFEFGDYFIMMNYISTPLLESPLNYDKFVKISESWKEIATTKEEEFDTLEEEFEALVGEEDYAAYFPNDLFETKISYYDILPDFDEGWDDVMDESGHLLSMFTYKEDKGFIKIFSGGLASSYPSEEEMADAVELAMDWKRPMTLEFNSQFSNEDHVFRLYTISGGGTMSSVYTTIVNNEMVFFVVDGSSNPVDDFKPAVRDFMLTMWVDYFDPEDEDAQKNNPRY